MAFKSSTVIQRSPTEQLRIETTEFKRQPRIDVRTWRMFKGETEFKPTKNGIIVTPDIFEDLIAALTVHGKELPSTVHEMSGVKWVIVRRSEDAAMHKKHVFTSLEEAMLKEPPDGYSIFEVYIEDKAAITKLKRVARRRDSEWKMCKPKNHK